MKRKKVLKLDEDPRYAGFVERYAFDLERFAVEVVGSVPVPDQRYLFGAVQVPGCRVSVASGHGTGKTSGFAIIALWHLLSYRNSNTFISAPKLETVSKGVWKEFGDLLGKIERGPHAWLLQYFTVKQQLVYVNGYKLSWWISCKTAPRGSPENLAGAHRDWLLWLIDEASGVPDANFGVIGGSLTDARNRMVLASQPTRNTGFFYDTHHKLNATRGGAWTALTFDSEKSPLVSDAFLLEKMHQYGGRSDPQYQIKVRGLFPENLEGQLLSRSTLEAAIGVKPAVSASEEHGWAVLVDVGAGEYRDKSVVAVARLAGYGQSHEPDPRRMHVVKIPILSNTIQPTALIAEVMQIASKLSNAIIMVDGGGMGLMVVKRLQELGMPNVIKVLWGNPCFKKSLKETFFNQRAHAMVAIARATRAGHFTIAKDAFTDSRHESELLDQGSRIPYHFDDKARYVIEQKRSKAWEGLPSPDIWDSLSFAFLEDAQYIMSEAIEKAKTSSAREVARSKLQELVARKRKAPAGEQAATQAQEVAADP